MALKPAPVVDFSAVWLTRVSLSHNSILELAGRRSVRGEERCWFARPGAPWLSATSTVAPRPRGHCARGWRCM